MLVSSGVIQIKIQVRGRRFGDAGKLSCSFLLQFAVWITVGGTELVLLIDWNERGAGILRFLCRMFDQRSSPES